MPNKLTKKNVKFSNGAKAKYGFNLLVGVFCVSIVIGRLIFEPVPYYPEEDAMVINSLNTMFFIGFPAMIGLLNLFIGFTGYPTKDNPKGGSILW